MAAVEPLHKPARIQSLNPSTLEVLGEVDVTTPDQVVAAVQRARIAQPAWRALGFKERGQYILQAREVLRSRLEDTAELIARESGKVRFESLVADLLPVLDLMTYFAGKSGRLLRPRSVNLGPYRFLGRRSRLRYEPRGVIGIISPWNFPFSIPTGEVVMALMAGNAVILKPSEFTPLTGVRIQEIFNFAGLPDGVFQVLNGDGATGAALVDNVDMVAFTGSVRTGKRIMARAAERLTPVMLELGGKDPIVVLEGSDLDRAAQATVWGAFFNSGQVCASIERAYVHESLYEPYVERVVELTRQLRQGVGSDNDDFDVGAMANEPQLKIVADHVEDARTRGAKIHTGGRRNPDLPGYFYEPTVLTNVDHTFKIVRDETFGPILPIMKFRTEDEAVSLANDSVYGLNAAVFGPDLAHARKVAERVQAGTVMVNEVLYTHGLAATPWGGLKESGIGRTHGAVGLMEFCEVHHDHINTTWLPSPWWHPYTSGKRDAALGIADLMYGAGLETRLNGLRRFLRGVRSILAESKTEI